RLTPTPPPPLPPPSLHDALPISPRGHTRRTPEDCGAHRPELLDRGGPGHALRGTRRPLLRLRRGRRDPPHPQTRRTIGNGQPHRPADRGRPPPRRSAAGAPSPGTPSPPPHHRERPPAPPSGSRPPAAPPVCRRCPTPRNPIRSAPGERSSTASTSTPSASRA